MSEKKEAVGKTTNKFEVTIPQGEFTTRSIFTKEEICERMAWWLSEFKNVRIEEIKEY